MDPATAPPAPPSLPNIDRGVPLIAVYSSLCGISLLFLVLRLWARLSLRAIGWDDIFMSITWVRIPKNLP